MHAVHNLITVSKILIIKTKYGPDKIIVYTDRPDAFKEDKNVSCVMKFETPSGCGEKYCYQNFNKVPYEVIKA